MRALRQGNGAGHAALLSLSACLFGPYKSIAQLSRLSDSGAMRGQDYGMYSGGPDTMESSALGPQTWESFKVTHFSLPFCRAGCEAS